MAGKGVATWVKVKNSKGLTPRPISHKYEGGASFDPGQVITMSEYQKLKAEGNQKREETKRGGKEAIGGEPKIIKSAESNKGKILSRSKMQSDGFFKGSVMVPSYRDGREIEDIRGSIIGDFVVHKGSNNTGYQITHIPSGANVLQNSQINEIVGNGGLESAKYIAKMIHSSGTAFPAKSKDEFKSLTTGNGKPFIDALEKIKLELKDTSNARFVEFNNDFGYAKSPTGHYYRVDRNRVQLLTGKQRDDAANFFESR